MSNTVNCRVQIWASDEATDKIYEMVESLPKVEYGLETKAIVEHFYTDSEIMSDGTNPISEKGVNITWLNKWVGCKWISVHIDDEIRIESAHTPNGFIVKLWSIATQIDPECQVICKWTDEVQVGTILVKNGLCAESYQLLDDDLESDELYDIISELQDSTNSSCEEAIDTEDFDFPDVKMYRIANKKWEIVDNISELMS